MTQISLQLDLSGLTVPDRLELIGKIWDSIETEQEVVPLTPEQRAELDRRVKDLEKNPDAEAPWEEVRARIQGQK